MKFSDIKIEEEEKKYKFDVKRGEIYMCDLGGIYGRRPVLIIQNDLGNTHSPRTIVAVLTSNTTYKGRPTHIYFTPATTGIKSVIQFENLHTVDKDQLLFWMDKVEFGEDMETALRISLGLAKVKPEKEEAEEGEAMKASVEIKEKNKMPEIKIEGSLKDTLEIVLEGNAFKERDSIKIVIN
ncbi:MAG: type II toxin-antitoxin system PemK/MazF family toxin [Defluviitaleaceae bacterium]|nr:type II toxin-antitoxin system PemK/MazF family toxin [Defluviitaleaceae bacterium]